MNRSNHHNMTRLDIYIGETLTFEKSHTLICACSGAEQQSCSSF